MPAANAEQSALWAEPLKRLHGKRLHGSSVERRSHHIPSHGKGKQTALWFHAPHHIQQQRGADTPVDRKHCRLKESRAQLICL